MLVIEKQGINSDHILEINVKDIANIQWFCVVMRGEEMKAGKKKEEKLNWVYGYDIILISCLD